MHNKDSLSRNSIISYGTLDFREKENDAVHLGLKQRIKLWKKKEKKNGFLVRYARLQEQLHL